MKNMFGAQRECATAVAVDSSGIAKSERRRNYERFFTHRA